MTSDPIPPDGPAQPPAPHQPSSPPRRIGSFEILRGEHEVLIDHEGETYRLRQTRNGKLILQK